MVVHTTFRPAPVSRFIAGILLTAAAMGAVRVSRRADGPLAVNVPSYRFRGPSKAPVTITVFSDFQCPSCGKAEPVLKELLDRHPGKIRLVFRHNPLRRHPWAPLAARAAEAAGMQGKFWEYHDVLFDRQADWSAADPTALFIRYAGELGLDADRFGRDFREGRWDSLVEADKEAARAASVDATPTFFINGERVVGPAQLRDNGERLVQEGGG